MKKKRLFSKKFSHLRKNISTDPGGQWKTSEAGPVGPGKFFRSPGPGRPKAAAFSRSARQNRPWHLRSARGPYTDGPARRRREYRRERAPGRPGARRAGPAPLPSSGGGPAGGADAEDHRAGPRPRPTAGPPPGTAAGRRGRCSSPEQPPEEALVRLLLFIGEGLDGALDQKVAAV